MIVEVGIATEGGVQKLGEVSWRIGLQPGGELGDPVEKAARPSPLLG
ncbi:MAG: hypothetical protein ACYC3V_10940 [Chloroflexota bacterium]